MVQYHGHLNANFWLDYCSPRLRINRHTVISIEHMEFITKNPGISRKTFEAFFEIVIEHLDSRMSTDVDMRVEIAYIPKLELVRRQPMDMAQRIL
jgi:hypothetical protein